LITGAGRGIGAATARLFAKKGMDVVINYRENQASAENLCAEILGFGGVAQVIQADISVETEVQKLFKEIDSRMGRIDVLVNNAGILLRQSKLVDFSADRLQKIMQTNVIGAFICCREALLRMSYKSGGKGGVIVNVSSLAAQLGAPNEYIDYAASKGAIDTLTRGLALEVAREGVRVNAVRPGLIETEIHASGGEPGRVERLKSKIPLGRGGTAEEVAEAIWWLASDQSAYTTGAFIDVSGGR